MESINVHRLTSVIRYLAIGLAVEEAKADMDDGDVLSHDEIHFVEDSYDAAAKECHPLIPPPDSTYNLLSMAEFQDFDLHDAMEIEIVLINERAAFLREFWELYGEEIMEADGDVLAYMVEVYREEVEAIDEWYRTNH